LLELESFFSVLSVSSVAIVEPETASSAFSRTRFAATFFPPLLLPALRLIRRGAISREFRPLAAIFSTTILFLVALLDQMLEVRRHW
jgi:hypothetical protein